MKQKLIAVTAVALLLTLLLTACGGANKENDPNQTSTTTGGESFITSSGDSSGTDSAISSTGSSSDTAAQTSSAGSSSKTQTATSSTAPKVESKTESKDNPKLTNRQVKLNGQVLEIGMKITDKIINAVGKPTDVQTAPSCHYDGEDTIYVYDGFKLYTTVADGSNILYLIEITKKGIPLNTGAEVGMTFEKIKELQGSDFTDSPQGIEYTLAKNLYLDFTGSGTVTMIEIFTEDE